MLNNLIDDFYSKLALSFHRNASSYKKREDLAVLSSIDLSTLEIVYLLKNPTFKELAEFLKISTPNTAYRIKKLIEKGYLTKKQDEIDRRKYYLSVTDKFMDYYCVNDDFMESVAKRAEQRFGKEELDQFQRMFQIIIYELMD